LTILKLYQMKMTLEIALLMITVFGSSSSHRSWWKIPQLSWVQFRSVLTFYFSQFLKLKIIFNFLFLSLVSDALRCTNESFLMKISAKPKNIFISVTHFSNILDFSCTQFNITTRWNYNYVRKFLKIKFNLVALSSFNLFMTSIV
jgi:hypothetical protein